MSGEAVARKSGVGGVEGWGVAVVVTEGFLSSGSHLGAKMWTSGS